MLLNINKIEESEIEETRKNPIYLFLTFINNTKEIKERGKNCMRKEFLSVFKNGC